MWGFSSGDSHNRFGKASGITEWSARLAEHHYLCWFSTAFSCTGITVQASLQRYRLHFGNPEISPTGFTIGVFIIQ